MPADHATSRRDRILAAAEAEFATHGFQGARVDRIASSAAVNKQLLFHYFDSKAGLHRAAAAAVAERSSIAPAAGRTPAERLRSLIGQLVHAAWGHETLLSDDWRSKATTAARGVVVEGQRSGHFRDDVEPDAIAEVIVAASFGRLVRSADDKRADVDRSKFAGSLAQMVIDHCNWR
jgi:AcrR family transcriptional regulator